MKKKTEKKIWLILIPVIVVICGVAIWLAARGGGGEAVYVYGFDDGVAGMSDYYDGMDQSDGRVSTDRIQPVYITETQTINEILVYEGQEVKKGDVLFTYDTTLSDIELRRKELSVDQLKLDLITAQQELAVINSYVPISTRPVETPDPDEEPDQPKINISDLDLEGRDYLVYSGKGDTRLTPKYCWLRSDTMLDELMYQSLFHQYDGDSLYIVFQHTEDDSNEGAITEEFGLKITRIVSDIDGEETIYRIGMFTPQIQADEPEDDGIEWNSGYTAAEIYQMRTEQQSRIKDLEFQIKMAEAEYRIMQKEADDGQVVAEFDGVVVGVQDIEYAKDSGEPLLKVSGGGGYYITGSVSELDLENLKIGQTVTIMSWENGMSYEGQVVEIQPFPQEDGNNYYYYGSSRNVSYYPYTVFVDESAQLQDGYWVSMTLQGDEGEGGLYINNAFVLNEGAASYVYVRGENGTLEKRRVQVGGMLWGSYTEIISGISAEDYVAFPYGKSVREGAPTTEGTWENLYGY